MRTTGKSQKEPEEQSTTTMSDGSQSEDDEMKKYLSSEIVRVCISSPSLLAQDPKRCHDHVTARPWRWSAQVFPLCWNCGVLWVRFCTRDRSKRISELESCLFQRMGRARHTDSDSEFPLEEDSDFPLPGELTEPETDEPDSPSRQHVSKFWAWTHRVQSQSHPSAETMNLFFQKNQDHYFLSSFSFMKAECHRPCHVVETRCAHPLPQTPAWPWRW